MRGPPSDNGLNAVTRVEARDDDLASRANHIETVRLHLSGQAIVGPGRLGAARGAA